MMQYRALVRFDLQTIWLSEDFGAKRSRQGTIRKVAENSVFRVFVYLYKMANSDNQSTDEFENPKVENAEKAKCKVREIFGDETTKAFEGIEA